MHQILSCKKQQKQKEDREMEMDTHRDMERQRQGAWRQRDLCCLKYSLYAL